MDSKSDAFVYSLLGALVAGIVLWAITKQPAAPTMSYIPMTALPVSAPAPTRVRKIPLDRPHFCYCDSCGYEYVAQPNEVCENMKCPACGGGMRSGRRF